MSNVIEISPRLAAKRLLEAFEAFNTLDLEYWQQRRARVLVDKSLADTRKAAGDLLVFWTREYGESVGIDFDWPHDAVTHARKGEGL